MNKQDKVTTLNLSQSKPGNSLISKQTKLQWLS